MHIAISKHSKSFLQTPAMSLGIIELSVSHFNTLHPTLFVNLGMFLPPQSGIRLLSVPAGMIPENKSMLIFGCLKRIVPIILIQRIAIVQKNRIEMARCHRTGDLASPNQQNIMPLCRAFGYLKRATMMPRHIFLMRTVLQMFRQGYRIQSFTPSLINSYGRPD